MDVYRPTKATMLYECNSLLFRPRTEMPLSSLL